MMIRKYVGGLAAVLMMAGMTATPARADDGFSSGSMIDAFYRNIDAFYRNIDAFYRNIDAF